MRKTVTIPAPGAVEKVGIIGMSVIIENAPFVSGPAQVPLISLEQQGDWKPMNNAAIWRNTVNDKEFNWAYVQGTAESEGATVYLISTPDILLEDVGIIQYATSLKATDSSLQGSNTAETIPDAILTDTDGNYPSSGTIWVTGGATRGINYAFGVNPPQNYGNTALYLDNDVAHTPRDSAPLALNSLVELQNFRFISAVNGETPTLLITLLYD